MKKTCLTGCNSKIGWMLLVVGLLYLAEDLGWITWWNLNWWTVGFLILAAKMLTRECCE